MPVTLGCGHTICKSCLCTLHRIQCPFDQANITKDISTLPINTALLQLVCTPSKLDHYKIVPQDVINLSKEEYEGYKSATTSIEKLAVYLKPSGNISTLLSRPMQRKLVALINCQLVEDEGRTRALRAARSLGERSVTELILQHQNPQQLSQNLWAAVRARGCQFLGPAMQEEVLKLVLLVLEDGAALSRKVLVMYVVQQLKLHFPQASKTSIGHVVQLLYRASCFKVSKRESDSSLMTLKEEFRTYETLRREHDTQIVQIATEAGLRIAPDQWSALLYGDNNHKSHMQSIIDKMQSPSSFAMSINELVLALQRTGDPANLTRLRECMDKLAAIDASTESTVVPSYADCSDALEAVRKIVYGLVDYVQNYGNRKIQEAHHLIHASRYKVSFCREFKSRGNCSRGHNCNFAHSEEELERFRNKQKKNSGASGAGGSGGGVGGGARSNNSSSMAADGATRDVINYGPNSKPNQHHSHSSSFAPKNHDNSQRFNKQMPYRSENSLHHSPVTPHHLNPAAVYPNVSSTSTPNLSMQHSPNQQKPHTSNGGPRFIFNGNHQSYADQAKSSSHMSSAKYMNFNRPPMSAPPVAQPFNVYAKSPADFSKKQQLSPYNNRNVPNHVSKNHHHHMPYYNNSSSNNNGNNGYYPNLLQPTSPPSAASHNFFDSSRNSGGSDELNSSSSSSFGEPKLAQWRHPKSPMMAGSSKSPTFQPISKSANASPNFRCGNEMSSVHDFKRNSNMSSNNNSLVHMPMQINVPQMMYSPVQNCMQGGDETDGSMWKYPQNMPMQSVNKSTYVFKPTTANTTISMNKDKFIRSDSILTSNTDDSFDNLPIPNGKYGPIGIKNKNNHETAEWSGLQQTIASRFDINSGGSSGVDSSATFKSAVRSGSPIAENVLNGNFLNMHIGETTAAASTADLWSEPKWSNKDFDFTKDEIDKFWNILKE